MKTSFLDLSDGALIPLPEQGGMPESVHVVDEDSVFAINAALAARRPLLARGEPGSGKSPLARAAAAALRRAFVQVVVDSQTEPRDLLWSVDAVARLAEAQVMAAVRDAGEETALRRIDVARFLQPGALWWAFDWASAKRQAQKARATAPVPPKGWKPERGVVVLVDEIDKADASVPNALLDALGHGRFDVPGREPVALTRTVPPLVVITTNEERVLPDAFVRRCLVLHLGLPDDPAELSARLIARGRAHFPDCAPEVLELAADLLIRDREPLRRRGLAAPGLAEYIDHVRAALEQRETPAEQMALMKRIAKYVLQKHPPEARA